MNPREAAELLGHCAAFDNRKPSQGAALAWAAALHDVPLDADAKAAVASYYTTAPKDPEAKLWILPHHVRTLRSKIRSKRLENFQYEPVDGETTAEYLARYKGQVQAIASGRVPAPTAELAPRKGEPPRELMAGLADRGWGGNRIVDDEESPAVELVDEVRRSGPLGVECPVGKCRAAIGKPCKGPGGSEKQPLGKPRLKPHSARIRAASGESEATAEERAAQEQRIRQLSAAHLAREVEDIPDAVIVDEEAAS
ncbi:zinc finger domain-containing protein [Streptomyces griseorubiginosus]|uniref:zinc finger domain-containing protein n=1 Tax=Streptomyces griseorubiginosus TaxID=67304 RepID=UPI003316CD5A